MKRKQRRCSASAGLRLCFRILFKKQVSHDVAHLAIVSQAMATDMYTIGTVNRCIGLACLDAIFEVSGSHGQDSRHGCGWCV